MHSYRRVLVSAFALASMWICSCGDNDLVVGSPTATANGDAGQSADLFGDAPGVAANDKCPTLGETRACYDGPPATRGVGACKLGSQICAKVAGTNEFPEYHYSECKGEVLPSAEKCDGLDHDCDGAADEGCSCNTGESRPCGTAWTIAPCHPGTQTCTSGTWGVCQGARAPQDKCECVPLSDACKGGVIGADAGSGDSGGSSLTADCSLPAPRLIFPMSTSTVTSQKPNLRWELASGTDGARIQICADRACNTILQTIDTTGTTGAPPSDLPPGVAFWRALGKKGSSVGCTPSFTWEMFVGHRSAPVNTAWGSFSDPNGDGYADVMLACDQTMKTICVYPGGPNGISTTAQIANAPSIGDSIPFYMRGGDVNGDGFFDLVALTTKLTGTSNHSYVYLSVYAGGPNGLSSTPTWTTTTSTTYWPANAEAAGGDINGDGYGDIVVGNMYPYETYVYLGGPNGFAATGKKIGTQDQPRNFALTDMNGDTYADAMMTGGSDTVAVFLGGPSGLGASPLSDASACPAAAGCGDDSVGDAVDVNGDGYGDVFLGGPTVNYVRLGGPTALGAPQAFASNCSGESSARVGGDIDGDGYSDLLEGPCNGGSGVSFFRGVPSGISASPAGPPWATTGVGGYYWGVGDTNGDHLLDVVLITQTNAVSVFVGTPSGPASTPSATLPGTILFAGDLDFS